MKVVIYGNSDFAELMYYYFTSDSQYQVIGFCVDKSYIKSKTFLDKPLVSFDDVLSIFPPSIYHMFVAVGYKSMRLRRELFNKAKMKGYKFANYISTKANIDNSNIIGENNAILHNVTMEPFSKLGNNNIINTNSILCHHSEIHNDCFIAANSLIGGFSIIEDNCFIGFSATILQKLILRTETLVGASCLMNVNSEKFTMYTGIPAKVISVHYKYGIIIKDKDEYSK